MNSENFEPGYNKTEVENWKYYQDFMINQIERTQASLKEIERDLTVLSLRYYIYRDEELSLTYPQALHEFDENYHQLFHSKLKQEKQLHQYLAELQRVEQEIYDDIELKERYLKATQRTVKFNREDEAC
ncbi:MAG: hypothetical protein ACRCST_06805 [Turicibacter sp.]